MLPEPTKTVRELAIAIPHATRVFERMRIDYCCGGNQPLNEACVQAGLDVDEVIQLLSHAGTTDNGSDSNNLQTLPLAQLAEYIVTKHHVYTREELERLTELLKKVCSVHGANHPELLKIESQFQQLKFELEPHMLKEERILFPYITRLETAALENSPAPFAPFGTVQNPIAAMMREHDAAGEIMKAIRHLSGNFALPEDACFSFRTLYTVLEELEADLHQHIHLENNVLFLRALEIENNLHPVVVG